MLNEPLVSELPSKVANPSAPSGPGDARQAAPARDAVAAVPAERPLSNGYRTGKMILLAEDSDDMRTLLSKYLRRAGYLVTECRNGSELVRELAEYLDDVPRELMLQHYDLIISDIRMPGISGMSVAEAACDCREFPPTILITAFGDEETHEQALRSGVAAVFDKPFDIADLLLKVREVLAKRNGSRGEEWPYIKWPFIQPESR